MSETTERRAGGKPQVRGEMLELEPGRWVRAGAIAAVTAGARPGAAAREVLASVLDAEGVAAEVAAELEHTAPASARGPADETRCRVRLLGETDWQPCAYPADAVLSIPAALAGAGR
jgi:hypothetical protein